jgi:hypothetical protein
MAAAAAAAAAGRPPPPLGRAGGLGDAATLARLVRTSGKLELLDAILPRLEVTL